VFTAGSGLRQNLPAFGPGYIQKAKSGLSGSRNREEEMKSALIGMAAAAAMIAGSAMAAQGAEPIEGTWKRPSTGTIIQFAGSDGKYCGTVMSGKFVGQSIGCMEGAGNSYKGSITDLEKQKTYKGRANISAEGMKLEGCFLLVCQGETWVRQ
jgi:uncharacterized protein (DUF2147 family)